MNIYISITSIFQRQKLLVDFLKSVLNLKLKPNKCFIFLSENPYLIDTGFKNKIITNTKLKEIIKNNNIFEIRWVENIGPYRKLIPLLKEKWNENCLIFTFDDDIILNHNILNRYISDYNKYKCCISYRGFNTNIKNINDFNYSNNIYTDKEPNKFNFANSGVGMITHPSFFYKDNIILDKKKFLKLAPTADDLWYYISRIKNNIKTKIIFNSNLFNLKYDRKTALFHNYNMKKNTVIFKNIIKNI